MGLKLLMTYPDIPKPLQETPPHPAGHGCPLRRPLPLPTGEHHGAASHRDTHGPRLLTPSRGALGKHCSDQHWLFGSTPRRACKSGGPCGCWLPGVFVFVFVFFYKSHSAPSRCTCQCFWAHRGKVTLLNLDLCQRPNTRPSAFYLIRFILFSLTPTFTVWTSNCCSEI